MTIYDVIIEDHANLLRLIHWLEEADEGMTEPSERDEWMTSLDRSLSVHLRAENEVMFERVRESARTGDLIGQIEHVRITMETLLDDLRTVRRDRDLRLAKLHALKVHLLRHIDDTEKGLMPELRRILSGQDEFRLGATMIGRKSQMMESAISDAEPDASLRAA